jgi:predicted Zn-dependent protease
MAKRIGVLIFCTVFCLCAVGAAPARAQKISIVRDAEIENTIRAYATPLWRVAGINPDTVSIHLIGDDTLNAFVAIGQNLFVNTGLLIRSENASQVIGVLAHESGHIADGHLVRSKDAIDAANTESLLSLLFGLPAMVLGHGDAGAAVMMGGQSTAMRSFLAFSRTQEAAADQAGMRFLDATKQSAKGFLEFFQILGEQELLSVSQQDPYVQTHPLTRDRVEAVKTHVAKSPYSNNQPSADFQLRHTRMKAKLIGFMRGLGPTLKAYPDSDMSVGGRYARAIAYYRVANLAKALPLIDSLLAEAPNDAYYHELRGQMLFENGRVTEALPSYEKAVANAPDEPLLQSELAAAEIETNDPAKLDGAIKHLQFALARDDGDSGSWRQLAIAYGRSNRMGESSRALAEEALLQGKYIEALGLAKRAQSQLTKGSPDWIRAGDIIAQAEDLQKRQRR